MKNHKRRAFLKSSRHLNGGEVVKIRKESKRLIGVDFAKGQDYSAIGHVPINIPIDIPIDIKPPHLPLPNAGEEFFRKLGK